MATEYGTRLRRARNHAGFTQVQLSALTGIPQSTISTAEREGHGSAETPVYAKACGVDAHWLATGDGEMIPSIQSANVRFSTTPEDRTEFLAVDRAPPSINLTNNLDYPPIRRVRFKLSAGTSGFAVEYLDGEEDPIVFKRQWYEKRGFKPEKLFATKVANGSMETGLYDGDTVVVNTEQAAPKDGIVFAVNFEGEMVVKRLVRDGGQWWLSSDNPDKRKYPRKVCDENVFLIGEVVHKQSEHI